MERWLLISNCQTVGLANSFQLLNRRFDVTGLDIWGYLNDIEKWEASFSDYFRVVVSPEVEAFIPNGLPNAPNLTRVPALSFSGFHPDLSYVNGPAGAVRGPLGNYHSLIAFAAYMKGLSFEDAVALFNAKFFEQCGYFDYWEPQKATVLNQFKTHGIDISDQFVRWGRYGSFMHSSDHPKIDVIYDVAKAFLVAGGVEVQDSEFRPYDGLRNGPCWPVYPEIGEVLGIEGSYNFKRDMVFRHTDLAGFVWESYAAYAEFDRAELSPAPPFKGMFDHVSGLI